MLIRCKFFIIFSFLPRLNIQDCIMVMDTLQSTKRGLPIAGGFTVVLNGRNPSTVFGLSEKH
jgi:hypothetical protein